MKLSEKIIQLRKMNGLTQEELAAICNVSRQSISKWEADIALPETEKLIILGNLFHVSIDVLLKDELTIGTVKPMHSCSKNAVREKQAELFEGILIKESISDETIIDFLNINKIELWNTGGKPKYWTALFFTRAEMICRNYFLTLCGLIPKMATTGLLISNQEMKNISCLKIKS